jgi:hypothetical protein
MLIVSLWAYDSSVLSVTPSNTWKLLSDVEYHIPGAVNGMVAPTKTWFKMWL